MYLCLSNQTTIKSDKMNKQTLRMGSLLAMAFGCVHVTFSDTNFH